MSRLLCDWSNGYTSDPAVVWGKERGLTKRLEIEPSVARDIREKSRGQDARERRDYGEFELCVALRTISSPEFSGSSVSGGSTGRTLGTRNFYRRNRGVPVLVRMLGFDENGSHHEVSGII